VASLDCLSEPVQAAYREQAKAAIAAMCVVEIPASTLIEKMRQAHKDGRCGRNGYECLVCHGQNISDRAGENVLRAAGVIGDKEAWSPKREMVTLKELRDYKDCKRMLQTLCNMSGITPDMIRIAANDAVLHRVAKPEIKGGSS
jgi:hypothetical protein